MTSLHVFYTFTVYTSVDGSRGRGKRRRRRRRRQRRQSECEQVELSDQSKLGSCQIDSPDSDPPSTILGKGNAHIRIYCAAVGFPREKNARWLFVVGRRRKKRKRKQSEQLSFSHRQISSLRASGRTRASCGRGCQPIVTSPLVPAGQSVFYFLTAATALQHKTSNRSVAVHARCLALCSQSQVPRYCLALAPTHPSMQDGPRLTLLRFCEETGA